MRKGHLLLLAALAAVLAVGPAAIAHHPDHGNKELFPGEGVLPADQHSQEDGHLPPVDRNVRLVGKAEVFNPAGTGNDGRVADVSAYRDHAFLTAFRDPTCERAGAHVIDISNPRRPSEVRSAFMETTPQNYAGEGSDVLRMKNRFFNGVLFMHQNETCPGAPPPTQPGTRGGINIWNVTDAERPELLVKHAGDYQGGLFNDQANQTHSQFAWTNKFTNKTYVVLVDDEEFTDLDILEITDPRNPVLINDTLDLNEAPFEVDQDSPSNLTDSFSHDMTVHRGAGAYICGEETGLIESLEAYLLRNVGEVIARLERLEGAIGARR